MLCQFVWIQHKSKQYHSSGSGVVCLVFSNALADFEFLLPLLLLSQPLLLLLLCRQGDLLLARDPPVGW
jgi:hypothetical protein